MVLFKKAAALKKQLLRICNSRVELVALKKIVEVASPKSKLFRKSGNIWEKRNRKIPN